MKCASARLKVNKPCDESGLAAELLQYVPDEFLVELHCFFMEQRFNNKLDKSGDDLRMHFMEKLREEKDARVTLERRICELENRGSSSWQVPPMDVEEVDKSVVVVGGFIEKTIADVESLMEEMMSGIAGYKDVEIIETTPPIALAHFDSPERAMKFIKSQKKNADNPCKQIVGFRKQIQTREASVQNGE